MCDVDTAAFCSEDKWRSGNNASHEHYIGVLPRASGFTHATSFGLCNSLVGGVCPRLGGEKTTVHSHSQFAIAPTLTHCLL